jgi:hypothetical protein
MITKEDINKHPYDVDYLGYIATELLKERDAYREAGATIYANKDRGLPIFTADKKDFEFIDAEAQKILKEKEK